MNIIDSHGGEIISNLIKTLEASVNEDHERVKELGDNNYFLILDTFYRNSRLIFELEEIINTENLPAEHLKYFFESIISSLKDSAMEKYKLLRSYEKVQRKYGVTNAPTE